MSAFYAEVLRLLSSPPLNQHFDKSWTAHVQVKETLYDVESQLQQAAQLHKDDDIAPEIARLKVIQLPRTLLCRRGTLCQTPVIGRMHVSCTEHYVDYVPQVQHLLCCNPST